MAGTRHSRLHQEPRASGQYRSHAGEMLLLPTFRLPTLIHTRSGNAKWLYEISNRNPLWLNPKDAKNLEVKTGDLLKVQPRSATSSTKSG